MPISFSFAGTVIRAFSEVVGECPHSTIANALDLDLNDECTEDAPGSVEIAASGTHAIQMAHIASGKFFAMRVVTADKVVNLSINGGAAFPVRGIVFHRSGITSVSINNPDATVPVHVQWVLGG